MIGCQVVTGMIGATNVDEDAAFQLQYPSGVIGSFLVSLRVWAPDDFQGLGPDGVIGVEPACGEPSDGECAVMPLYRRGRHRRHDLQGHPKPGN